MNVNAAAGTMRVAVLDEQEARVEPFSLANCLPVTTDSVRHSIRWRGSDSLASVVGRTVRLKFEFTNAEFYSFWTGTERDWHTPDTSTWQSPD